MNLFIDAVCARGMYRAAPCPSWLDLRLPPRLLLAGAPNVPRMRADQRLRLFHVEARRFLPTGPLRYEWFAELDTIIVVGNDDPTFADTGALSALWEVTGGPRRHVARLAQLTGEISC